MSSRIQIPYKTIFFMLALFPFFEPMMFGILEDAGIQVSLWGTVGKVYLGVRVLIAAAALVVLALRLCLMRTKVTRAGLLLMLNILFWGVSSVFTHSADMKLWANVGQNLGFIALCMLMAQASRRNFFRACMCVFGILTVAGVCSILLHPYGYLNARDSYSAYYLLGGKNGSFPYYYFFFFSSVLHAMLWHRRSLWLYPFYGLTLLAALICRSANSLLCLVLIIVCDELRRRNRSLVVAIRPKLVMAVLFAVIILIYVGSTVTLFMSIIQRLGRDSTISGRDVLWAQAFQYLRESPLWGKGYEAVFTLRDLRDAGHAHSQYLHRLATYGIVPFVFFAASVVSVLAEGDRCKDRYVVNAMELLFSVYLLHMAFDTYPYYFVMLLVLMGEQAIEQCLDVQRHPILTLMK